MLRRIQRPRMRFLRQSKLNRVSSAERKWLCTTAQAVLTSSWTTRFTMSQSSRPIIPAVLRVSFCVRAATHQELSSPFTLHVSGTTIFRCRRAGPPLRALSITIFRLQSLALSFACKRSFYISLANAHSIFCSAALMHRLV